MNKETEPKQPPFKEEYLEAFLCLMLKKLGGHQTITVELLEKFPKGSKTKVIYNAELKAYTIIAPEESVIKRKRKIITRN